MKFRASSLLRVFAFAACSLVLFSCEEEENYDNFGPSTSFDDEPKRLSGTVEYPVFLTFDSIGLVNSGLAPNIVDSLLVRLDSLGLSSVRFQTGTQVDDLSFSNSANNIIVKQPFVTSGPIGIPSTLPSRLIGVTGYTTARAGLAITVPFLADPDTFHLTASSPVQARYFIDGYTYITKSGQLILTLNDTASGRIAGTFNFISPDSSLIKVTNGSFDIDYVKADPRL